MSEAKISVVLLCGGKGARMGANVPKQYLLLKGKPIAQYSFNLFESQPSVSEIIVVCEPKFQRYFSNSCKKVSFAQPGLRRQDSVYQGLQKVSKDCDLISIHDSARPFISSEVFDRVCAEAFKYGAAAVGVPIPFTVKESSPQGFVVCTLQRENIWEIQTPQVLRPEILHRGFEYAIKNNITVTDDVSLAELMGHSVKIVEGSRENFKITTREDLAIAETFLSRNFYPGTCANTILSVERSEDGLSDLCLEEGEESAQVQISHKISIKDEQVYKYKLTIAYDGTQYGGWQIQPNTMTIQQKMQETLKIFLKKEIQLTGSGRTDAGVHAKGQTAHFTYHEEINGAHFLKVGNSLLPKDIRIIQIEPVHPSFHARYSAKSKIYHYHIFLDPVLDPFRRLYVLHLRRKFDLALCKQAAALFVGEHDFTSFANEPGITRVSYKSSKGGEPDGSIVYDKLDSSKRNPIRTLKRLDIIEEKGGVRLEFESQGFLYKMVRNIVWTLVEVATQQRVIEEIPTIFAAKDRKAAGMAAPPQGLCLYKVKY